MSKSAKPPIVRLGAMALYIAAAWVSLGVLLTALPWAPEEPFMQSGRVMILVVASIAMLVSVVGAAGGVLSAAAASVPDPEPRP